MLPEGRNRSTGRHTRLIDRPRACEKFSFSGGTGPPRANQRPRTWFRNCGGVRDPDIGFSMFAAPTTNDRYSFCGAAEASVDVVVASASVRARALPVWARCRLSSKIAEWLVVDAKRPLTAGLARVWAGTAASGNSRPSSEQVLSPRCGWGGWRLLPSVALCGRLQKPSSARKGAPPWKLRQ